MRVVICTLFSLLAFIFATSAWSEDLPRYTDHEITTPTPLLNPDGILKAWGWARHPYMLPNTEAIKSDLQPRLKAWDYYAFTTPECYIEVTLANISWATLTVVNVCDYTTGETHSSFYMGKEMESLQLPDDPRTPVTYDSPPRKIAVAVAGDTKTLSFDVPATWLVGPAMKGTITIQAPADSEQLATAMPFDEPGTFFYTNKMTAMPATGSVRVGDETYSLKEGEAFALLDWGRGVWPKAFEWTWAVAAGEVDGHRVGINIGYGDEDDSRCSANAIVVDGVLHKLGEVAWEWSREDLMAPWTFKSSDGRFAMTMDPDFDQSGQFDVGSYSSTVNKVHGPWSGHIVLDDGTRLKIEGIRGFAEHCLQRW